MPTTRYTITTFNREFPDDDACLDFLFAARWPDGVTCRACQRVTKHYRIEGRRGYSCTICGAYVFPTAGTIFHKSETSLRLWFYAMFLMASTRCGISAKQLQREIGVTYKTAWRIFHQIRKLMAEDGEGGSLSGQIEADETYIGGKRPGKPGRGAEGKTVAFGLVERRGHSQEEFVRGEVHTNTIEGFWSLVKRGIDGVYHSVSPKYLAAYIDEYAYRYSRRHSLIPLFLSLLRRASDLQLVERIA